MRRINTGVKRGMAWCLIAMMLSGCQNKDALQDPKSIRIGVTVYDQYDTFISQLITCFHIEVYNAADSQTTQNSQVEEMLENGCDVICVNLVDRTDPTTIIDLAEKQNIPLIFFNRELVEEDLERWNRLYYVGAKAFESGVMQGEIAAEIFQSDPSVDKNQDGIFQYVVLEGEAGHQDAIVRTEYAVSTLVEQQVLVEKLGYGIANWNRAQAQTKMTQMLDQHGKEIELVLANNDDMALGAVDALKALQIPREDWPVIMGIDGTDVGLEAVANKELAGTVYNDKEGQALAMLNLAYQLATGGELSDLALEDEKYIRLPYAKVESEDVERYQNREKL